MQYEQKTSDSDQENSDSELDMAHNQNGETAEADISNRIFVIRHIDFDITGRSRPFALLYHGEFQAGERIRGEARLQKYIKDKTQLLLNQRVLETAEIDYRLGEAEADGQVPVDLLIKVVDTWNIIALPYPKFDSNKGFEFIIKARDYNFLGTMAPLRIDLGYERRESDDEPVKNVLKFEIDSDTPFRAFGYNWNLDFDHIFSVTLKDEGPDFYYKNITGISVEFPYNRTILTLGFGEDSILYEENPSQYKQEYGDYADFYMSSRLYAVWKIPLGLKVYDFGELSYTPDVSGKFSYRPGGELEFWRKDPVITFGQSLGFGQFNWFGNYRSGLEAAIKNSNTYNFYDTGWSINYSISITGHSIFTDFFGISSRLQFWQWFFSDTNDNRYFSYVETGNALRGIPDKSLIAKDNNYMLSLNLDFPVRVLRFLPSEWLHNQKLRFFNFDFHISPFVDMALFQGLNQVKWEKGVIVEPKDVSLEIQIAGGLEFIVFPAFIRSLYLRGSFGYNLKEWAKTGKPSKWYGDEIFIGIGHHY